VNYFLGRTVGYELAVLKKDGSLADPGHRGQVVSYEQYCSTTSPRFLHLVQTFSLEGGIANRQDFVNNKDVWL
jgi:hypothetical protein